MNKKSFNYTIDINNNGRLITLSNSTNKLQQPNFVYRGEKLLIIILSGCREINIRNRIREHFKLLERRKLFQYFFVLGQNEYYNELITRENKENHDILQYAHIDSYMNISLSVLNAFQYIAQLRYDYQYVLKIDTDSVINFKKILTLINKFDSRRYIYAGTCYCNVRFTYDRIDSPPIEIFGNKTLPCYNTGGGYLLSLRGVKRIAIMTKYMDFLVCNEDVNVGRIWNEIGENCTKIDGWINQNTNNNYNSYYIIHRIKNLSLYSSIYNLLNNDLI